MSKKSPTFDYAAQILFKHLEDIYQRWRRAHPLGHFKGPSRRLTRLMVGILTENDDFDVSNAQYLKAFEYGFERGIYVAPRRNFGGKKRLKAFSDAAID